MDEYELKIHTQPSEPTGIRFVYTGKIQTMPRVIITDPESGMELYIDMTDREVELVEKLMSEEAEQPVSSLRKAEIVYQIIQQSHP